MKIVLLETAISEAKELVRKELAEGENADEFMGIEEAYGFRIYVAAGKIISGSSGSGAFHENPRETFLC